MTIRYELTKYLRRQKHIRQCINCYRIENGGNWYEYKNLPTWATRKVTGTICEDCWSERIMNIYEKRINDDI